MTGNVIPNNPQSYFCLILRMIVCIIFLIILIVASSDIDPILLSPNELFTEIFCFFTITLYIFYLFIIIIFTLSFQICKFNVSVAIIDVLYVLILPLIQCIVATSFQLFCYDIFGGHSLNSFVSLIVRISMLIIIIEFFLSLIQFNYIIGIISVLLYNIVYIILFDLVIKEEANNSIGDDNIDYISWIILCILWQFFLTHFKNWVNFKWFTSHRISVNIADLSILSKYSTKNGTAEMIALAFNDNFNNGIDEYCTIVMGSCTDQRKKTIATYQALHREHADIVLLLGDNVYNDLSPPTITKPITKITKPSKIFRDEYNLLLNHKDFRPEYDYTNQLWLALWDDHDYGDNDAAKDYERKIESKAAFIEFLEAIHKSDQVNDQLSDMKDDNDRGVYYSYDYQQELKSGNVTLRIIMMDTRYDRAEDETDIVGDAQWQWLREQMNGDDDIDWYLVCNGSPILNEGKNGKKTVGQETRDKLFEILHSFDDKLLNKIVLLSGDLHYHVWHSWNEQIYELTASSFTHSKQWFCCKCWYKYLDINQYVMAKENNGNGATTKSRNNCQKNGFGILKINKNKFNFCVKDAFGYSYINLSHTKK